MELRSTYRTCRTDVYDVVVVGGGLAGVCAAVGAARTGTRTALVHDRPMLGGNLSSEIRVGPSGAGDKNFLGVETGIACEIILEMRRRTPSGWGNAMTDLAMLEIVRREPALDLFLNAPVTHVETGDGRIAAVVAHQPGTETRWEIPGRVFVDASGDGLTGASAGAPFRVGEESRDEYGESFAPPEASPRTMGSSIMFRAADVGRPADFTPPAWAKRYDSIEAFRYRPLGSCHSGFWWMEIGWPHDTIAENEGIRDELMAHIYGVWDFVKNRHPELRDRLRNFVIEWIGSLPGKRESRRFVGPHVLTQNEIQRRELFPDRVGHGGYFIDDHARHGVLDLDSTPSLPGHTRMEVQVAAYSVPLRSLFVTEVENLFLAGRLISVSRVALCSLRVMLTLGTLGQAAGIAAAWCAERGISTATLAGDAACAGKHTQAIQQAVLRLDASIPRCPNADPDDLARLARVSASSEAPMAPDVAGDVARALPLERSLAQLIPIAPGGFGMASVYLRNDSERDRRIVARLIPAEDVWDVAALDRAFASGGAFAAQAEATVPAGHRGWFGLPLAYRPEAAGVAWLALSGEAGVSWRFTDGRIPGLSAAARTPERWWFAPEERKDYETFSVRLDPDPAAYGAANAVNGIARAEAWPNMWRSDPAKSLPADLTLEWNEPRPVGRVHLTFDTDLSRIAFRIPSLSAAPEAVRDYEIRVDDGAGWQTLVRETGNYLRHRVHRFDAVNARRLQLRVTATNGAADARLYEIRAYA